MLARKICIFPKTLMLLFQFHTYNLHYTGAKYDCLLVCRAVEKCNTRWCSQSYKDESMVAIDLWMPPCTKGEYSIKVIRVSFE